ncbi:MAG TPA: DUF2892 domain-containing protein [Chryseolinea sp.]|nr:DUF2892 domain-containing protein [Chryseolinea sp.]
MNKLTKGLTYSFHRNIGWQDKTIRAFVGLTAIVYAIYLFPLNPGYTIALGILAAAQLFTIAASRCIICYLAGSCTITGTEIKFLQRRGIPFEK